jgi:formiminotetrahydrofolate cyclodeaminase
MSSLHIRSLGQAPASIWALSASQVLDLTASLSPTPGGGSISIFTATLGLALVQKGASISHKRVGEDVDRREMLERLCGNISSTIAAISGLADEDSQAFQDFIAARSLPRTSDEEQSSRSAAMEVAIVRATRIPLASARSIWEALQLAESALSLSDQHLLSDVFGGAILMQAASKAVLLNVDANSSLLSGGLRVELQAEREEVAKLLLERGESIARAYEARMTDSKDFARVTD